MRIAVLILAGLGAVACGGFGVFWMIDLSRSSSVVDQLRIEVEAARKASRTLPDETLAGYRLIMGRIRAYPLLLANLAVGGFAAFLAFQGRGPFAAALLLLAAVGPAVIEPRTLIVTFLFVIGGILAFFIRPQTDDDGIALAEE